MSQRMQIVGASLLMLLSIPSYILVPLSPGALGFVVPAVIALCAATLAWRSGSRSFRALAIVWCVLTVGLAAVAMGLSAGVVAQSISGLV